MGTRGVSWSKRQKGLVVGVSLREREWGKTVAFAMSPFTTVATGTMKFWPDGMWRVRGV